MMIMIVETLETQVDSQSQKAREGKEREEG